MEIIIFPERKKKKRISYILPNHVVPHLSRVTIQRPITWSVEFLVLTETV